MMEIHSLSHFLSRNCDQIQSDSASCTLQISQICQHQLDAAALLCCGTWLCADAWAFPGDVLWVKKDVMEPLPLPAGPRLCRLLKQTLMRVRWKAALPSTILWKSFMAKGSSWSTASSWPPADSQSCLWFVSDPFTVYDTQSFTFQQHHNEENTSQRVEDITHQR